MSPESYGRVTATADFFSRLYPQVCLEWRAKVFSTESFPPLSGLQRRVNRSPCDVWGTVGGGGRLPQHVKPLLCQVTKYWRQVGGQRQLECVKLACVVIESILEVIVRHVR